MGRWDSPSPTRARSRSPRDNTTRKDNNSSRKDDDYRRDRNRERDGYRKRSRWEDDEEEKDGKEKDGKEVVRWRDERDRGERRRYDDRDGDRRRRDDGGGGSSRRGRDRGDKERDRSREREKDRDNRRGRRDDTDKSKPRNRSKDQRSSKDPQQIKAKEKDEEEEDEKDEKEAPPKEAPNFSRTTHLIAETNTLNGVILKYVEPTESRLPPSSKTYRLYIFKSSDLLETITLSTRTAWLFGRDRLVCDIPIDHPSASKQHAVIQFRFVVKVNEFGEKQGAVKPYIIDLGSANGTTVNGDQVPKERYFELKEKDVIGFGHSTREYVLMVEK